MCSGLMVEDTHPKVRAPPPFSNEEKKLCKEDDEAESTSLFKGPIVGYVRFRS